MSVDFSGGIVHGWKLTQGRYNELPDEIKEDYGVQTDCYGNGGEFFVGVNQYECDAGESDEIDTDAFAISFEDFAKIISAIPDVIAKRPDPTLYVYCRVH